MEAKRLTKNEAVIFDLDGVLLDYSFRFHKTYEDVLLKRGISCPRRNEIMEMRRQCRNSQAEMLERFLIPKEIAEREKIIIECARERAEIIENEEYVSLDRFFEGAFEVVSDLKGTGFITALITRRKNRELLLNQIGDKKGLFDFVDTSFEKKETIKRFLSEYNPSLCYFLTDTGNDVQDGKELGLIVIGVLSGLENEHRLREMGADAIVNNIREAYNLLI